MIECKNIMKVQLFYWQLFMEPDWKNYLPQEKLNPFVLFC